MRRRFTSSGVGKCRIVSFDTVEGGLEIVTLMFSTTSTVSWKWNKTCCPTRHHKSGERAEQLGSCSANCRKWIGAIPLPRVLEALLETAAIPCPDRSRWLVFLWKGECRTLGGGVENEDAHTSFR